MDKITESYIDSILHNSECTATYSQMTYSLVVVLPNGYVVSAVYPFFSKPDGDAERVAKEHCMNEIRSRIREFETYHLLSLQS